MGASITNPEPTFTSITIRAATRVQLDNFVHSGAAENYDHAWHVLLNGFNGNGSSREAPRDPSPVEHLRMGRTPAPLPPGAPPIRTLRTKLGLTQNAVGDALGLSGFTVCEAERRVGPPTESGARIIEHLRKLAQRKGIPLPAGWPSPP